MKSCRGGHRSPLAAHRFGRRLGSRKSSPACRCPRCWRRSTRPARHRARRGRRHLPAHAGCRIADLRSETPGWRRAAGRAGRSGCRREADRAASCRAGLRRAPAAPAAPASRAGSPAVRARRCRGRTVRRRLSMRRRTARHSIAVLDFEPRRQLPRELVEGGVFDRRQRRRFRLAGRTERHDVLRRSGGIPSAFRIVVMSCNLWSVHGVSKSV